MTAWANRALREAEGPAGGSRPFNRSVGKVGKSAPSPEPFRPHAGEVVVAGASSSPRSPRAARPSLVTPGHLHCVRLKGRPAEPPFNRSVGLVEVGPGPEPHRTRRARRAAPQQSRATRRRIVVDACPGPDLSGATPAVSGGTMGGNHGSVWTSARPARGPHVRPRRARRGAARRRGHPRRGHPVPGRGDGAHPDRPGCDRHQPGCRGPCARRRQPARARARGGAACLGDPAARAAEPELGHGRPPAGRPAAAGPPGPGRGGQRPAGPRRGPGPGAAAADRHRARGPCAGGRAPR